MTRTASSTPTVGCRICGGDTMPPTPGKPEEVDHYCERCGTTTAAEPYVHTCPTCSRPATRYAFPKSELYVSCSLGHVFAAVWA